MGTVVTRIDVGEWQPGLTPSIFDGFPSIYTSWLSGAVSEGAAFALIFSAANAALCEAALDRQVV